MGKCINCGRYTNTQFCDLCIIDIQDEIAKASSLSFKKYDKNKKYKCKSGIYVRSQAERTVCDFLYDNKIDFEYEPIRRYGEYNIVTGEIQGKILHPDFYIKGPTYFKGKLLSDIYIEFWGMNTDDYDDIKAYKLNVYKQHKSTLINLYFEDIYNYQATLTEKLLHYREQEINY